MRPSSGVTLDLMETEKNETNQRQRLEWRVATADDSQEWPCTIVDSEGRSLLAVHNGTPVIRDRSLADRIVAWLNADSAVLL